MSDQTPWWFSGDKSSPKGFDFGGLASGAQQVIAWARDSLLTNHQSHTDPADHPQCVLCKAMHLFQQTTVEPTLSEDAEFEWIDLDPPKDK
jgi:hypothetical protein